MHQKKHRHHSNTGSNKTLWQILILMAAIGLCVGAVIGLRKFFTVHTVQCQLLSGDTCSPDLNQAVSVLVGQNMFFENYTKKVLTSEILQQPVSVVKIKKIFPQTVIVVLQQEAAAYIISHAGTNQVVSQTGRIFTHQVNSSGLITAEIPEELITQQGFIDSGAHQVVLTILNTSSQLQLPLTKIIWVDKSTIKLSMENSSEQFILDGEHPVEQLNKLSLVLKSGEYKTIAQPKAELDLRFTMPVLRIEE